MNATPTLSIIIPTYKRPEKLDRALSSIGNAFSESHEIIVVDDCPEGSGFEVAKLFAARYFSKAGLQRGLSYSRNIGLSLARGRYVTFIDDDDYFSPGGLDHLLAETKMGAAVIFGDYATFSAEGTVTIQLAGLTFDHLLISNHIPVGAYIIERTAIVRNFDPHLRSHEDWEFLLANIENGGMTYASGLTAHIDKTENETNSMQARRRNQFWLDFISIYARFPAAHLASHRTQFLKNLGIAIPEELLSFTDII
jgi:glycosyltransferase involved in cell wall biosynthesis